MGFDAIVIGAGIVGLATSRALAVRGKKVLVIDRSSFAVGASIRNFGMIWPIGQSDGKMYERAMLSQSIWKEIAAASGIWHDPVGSLHLAYSDVEMEVLESFRDSVKNTRDYTLMSPSEACMRSTAIVHNGLKGGLYSPDEMIVDSPTAIKALPAYLTEKYGVEFLWDTHVQQVETGKVYSGNKVFEADEIYVCNGPDFENLFPETYAAMPITKCKLQMMRMGVQPNEWRMGPSLCGGLSLTHYASFSAAGEPLQRLKQHIEETLPDYVKWGIHVMVSQNASGELIIGDSHEYGLTHDPFEKSFINELILKYLSGFAKFQEEKITVNWNGVYAKLKDGRTEIVTSPIPGVTIINGLGGAGMTLSFGLAEQLIAGNYIP
jgi:FAD dependent oxidoreductase TIGR03364